ncbi:MAG: hypothetical protein ACRC42_03735 [Mycoplasma sp.]
MKIIKLDNKIAYFQDYIISCNQYMKMIMDVDSFKNMVNHVDKIANFCLEYFYNKSNFRWLLVDGQNNVNGMLFASIKCEGSSEDNINSFKYNKDEFENVKLDKFISKLIKENKIEKICQILDVKSLSNDDLKFLKFQIEINNNIEALSTDGECELILFAIDPKRQGLGYSKILLEQFYNQLKIAKINEFILYSDTGCDFEYYLHNGFSEIAKVEIKNDFKLLGSEVTNWFLYKFKKIIK